ncbi:hypothetical protein [Fimbriiglobus ruber]|uniref:hypothetical protein n=1 Tax=Fimbriiglobus ruber TaxID=1908690 RepID=UPI000B4B6827|nr:hypothetical protein [Fimbriiglobus ruber]
MTILVITFAFLAASFPARNSDLWLHLATGRLIAAGLFPLGEDPFAYTTGGAYWVNHAWLTDLGGYSAYQWLGGPALVALKAAAVALMAVVMLWSARGRGPFWVTAGCVLLAVLAMSPRLFLQPACLSPLLLAVCLALLRTGGRAWAAVPAVVALWANLDGWFVLGPLVAVLFWVGSRLSTGPRPPWWLPAACAAACLVTPYHVRGLTLPPDLSPAVWTGEFRDDPRFTGLFASPWQFAPLGRPGGINLAAAAYFVLLAVGLGSFAANPRAARGWRGLVWVAFALLGAWQARLVPYFAVVAGPVAALNFGEVVPRERAARAGLVATLGAAAALTAVALLGGLQGFHVRDRGVAWAVVADPSLERVAESLARWRRTGELSADARVFATHPDVDHYLAWFGGGEKGFLDSRLQLFAPVATDYARLTRALVPSEGGPVAGEPPAAWEQAARDRNVACLVLYDPNPRRFAEGLREVVRHPDRWVILRVDGNAVVVGWRGTPAVAAGGRAFSPEGAVFAPPAGRELPPAPGTVSRRPTRGPGPPPAGPTGGRGRPTRRRSTSGGLKTSWHGTRAGGTGVCRSGRWSAPRPGCRLRPGRGRDRLRPYPCSRSGPPAWPWRSGPAMPPRGPRWRGRTCSWPGRRGKRPVGRPASRHSPESDTSRPPPPWCRSRLSNPTNPPHTKPWPNFTPGSSSWTWPSAISRPRCGR